MEAILKRMGILCNWNKRTLYMHSLPFAKQECFKIHCIFLPLGRNSDFVFCMWRELPKDGLKIDLLMPDNYNKPC